MLFPQYVITGSVTLENFPRLWTSYRGFIWRGYTYEYEMLPSAANYNEYNEKITNYKTETCHPLAEIELVSEKVYELNKLQEFPFEIPLFVRKMLFQGFRPPEEADVLKDLDITCFPDKALAQVMSIVQHEFGGTSLLDFSFNRFKALYFAIGKGECVFQDSYLFGLPIAYFETHKNDLTAGSKTVYRVNKTRFDLLYPSYFMNDRIAHQEGVFLHQKFALCNQNREYENIINCLKERLENCAESVSGNRSIYEEISLDEFLQMTEQKGNKWILYILLKVPANEKAVFKAFLDSIGITENYMMNTIIGKEQKIESYFKGGDGI